MDTFIIILAGVGFGFLLLMLLIIGALSGGGGGGGYSSESSLPSPYSESRPPKRRPTPIWQILLAILFLCFTSDSGNDDRQD